MLLEMPFREIKDRIKDREITIIQVFLYSRLLEDFSEVGPGHSSRALALTTLCRMNWYDSFLDRFLTFMIVIGHESEMIRC